MAHLPPGNESSNHNQPVKVWSAKIYYSLLEKICNASKNKITSRDIIDRKGSKTLMVRGTGASISRGIRTDHNGRLWHCC